MASAGPCMMYGSLGATEAESYGNSSLARTASLDTTQARARGRNATVVVICALAAVTGVVASGAARGAVSNSFTSPTQLSQAAQVTFASLTPDDHLKSGTLKPHFYSSLRTVTRQKVTLRTWLYTPAKSRRACPLRRTMSTLEIAASQGRAMPI